MGEKSIHVRFYDRLDYEKLKLCEKLADVTIMFVEPKGKVQEDKESEAPSSDVVDSSSD